MPQVIVGAAISTAVASAGAYALGTLTVQFALATFGGSLVLGGLSYALTPKPKKPNYNSAPNQTTVAVRQSDLTRQIVYGHTRVTRGFAHMQSTGLNGKLHKIIS